MCNPKNIDAVVWDGFIKKGAVPFDTHILQPASLLLNLYGEDIRTRAFTTRDWENGELVLRPDFTVPVALDYLSKLKKTSKTEQAEHRYCYKGTVFRATDGDKIRRKEEGQIGFEIIGAQSPEDAEIEVFSAFYNIFKNYDVDFVFSDINLLFSAISDLKTSSWRKAFLNRHIWRPARFMELLERFAFAGDCQNEMVDEYAVVHSPEIGLRTIKEVQTRMHLLENDAQTPPLAEKEKERIKQLLAIRVSASQAVNALNELDFDSPAFGVRLKAFDKCGIDIERLTFEACYGQTSMEYYDGFIFGGYLRNHLNGLPIITGGRYDALMDALGAEKKVAAMGGVFRNNLFNRLEGKKADYGA